MAQRWRPLDMYPLPPGTQTETGGDMTELRDLPRTPLEEKLKGKIYPHSLLCSGSKAKPIGSPGCSCRIVPGDRA